MKLLNKVALITGAGSGMGKESAKLFAKEGAKVVIADINENAGKETESLIKEDGGECFFTKTDLSKRSEVEGMINQTIEKYNRLDILFNNAGIPMAGTPIEDVTDELWDKIFDVNVKALFWASRFVVPIMKKQGGGVIINTCSIVAVRARPKLSAYAASKGAAILLSKSLAIELAEHKIRVNVINPVATNTPMFEKFLPKEMDVEKGREIFKGTIPLGKFAEPIDIAYAALYLASDEASMITGSEINVDGGRAI